METYADRHFPPKAGVYAVRAGPFVSGNIVSYIKKEPLTKYVPQTGFLSLLMTGDGKAIGQKFGIAFTGRWVWEMKDYIDVGFMKLFDRRYLFRDPAHLTDPDERGETLEKEKAPI
jgi:selenide,water dikinase